MEVVEAKLMVEKKRIMVADLSIMYSVQRAWCEKKQKVISQAWE
jgi:hypothetical protein